MCSTARLRANSCPVSGPVHGCLSPDCRNVTVPSEVTLRIVVFAGSGVVIGMMAESLHRARRRAHEASLARGRSERTLESAQDRLRVIVDAAPALISYVDKHLRYRLVNATYEKWFGLSPAWHLLCDVSPERRLSAAHWIVRAARASSRCKPSAC